MLQLYKVSYQYRLAGDTNWIDDADAVVAGDNGQVAIAEVESAVRSATVDFSDDEDGSDVRAVEDFRLVALERVARVDRISVSALEQVGVLTEIDTVEETHYVDPPASDTLVATTQSPGPL
jgi:hypothetical protein